MSTDPTWRDPAAASAARTAFRRVFPGVMVAMYLAAADQTVQTMYRTCLGLAKQLKMLAVAEGVEDRSDWEFVRGTECDVAQGYFIAEE